MSIVFQTTIKDINQKKYYDFMANFELSNLFSKGVEGVRVKVFSTSMDTPGRAELMGKSFYYYILYKNALHMNS